MSKKASKEAERKGSVDFRDANVTFFQWLCFVFLISNAQQARKKADEALNEWAGTQAKPFPGIDLHESKESKVDDALSKWFGGDWRRKDLLTKQKIAASPRSPKCDKPFPGITLHKD